MKRIFTILATVLLTASVFTQAPEKMSYQAVIRDASNNLVTSQSVGMQVSILQNSASGTAVYVETQTPTTNANGLVSIEIGNGTVQSGDFATIDWANGSYFIKTETDPAGGTNYTITGTSQLLSVPYALHAKTAESITDAETDPVYISSQAANITSTHITNLNNLSGVNTGDQDLTPYATKNMANANITNLANPINDQDAATKAYIDEVKNNIYKEMVDAGLNGIVNDVEGNSYKTIKIGNQVWMAENLKTTKYVNDTDIIEVTDNTAWANLTTPAYCWLDNNSSAYTIYGALYNWYTIETGNLCPTGWHVPTDSEWTTLTNYLTNNGYGYGGSGTDIGKSMAATSGWTTHTTAGNVGNDQASNNSSGFTALPGGYRNNTGVFSTVGSNGYWWSATQANEGDAWRQNIAYNNNYLNRFSGSKKRGYSVRCIRD